MGFTWNIFDGLNREANIRQTRLTKQTLQLGREKAQNELGVLVDKLYSEIQNAKDDVAALNTTIETVSYTHLQFYPSGYSQIL